MSSDAPLERCIIERVFFLPCPSLSASRQSVLNPLEQVHGLPQKGSISLQKENEHWKFRFSYFRIQCTKLSREMMCMLRFISSSVLRWISINYGIKNWLTIVFKRIVQAMGSSGVQEYSRTGLSDLFVNSRTWFSKSYWISWMKVTEIHDFP